MIGVHGVGGACSHIKAFWLSHSPHQREFCTEGLLGRHALGMLGRTLVYKYKCTWCNTAAMIRHSRNHDGYC